MMVNEFIVILRPLLPSSLLYPVSLVDGFDLPMTITNNVGCHVAGCSADLNRNCP